MIGYRICSCTNASLACFFVFKQKTAYEMRISDWSSDVCSSDLRRLLVAEIGALRECAAGREQCECRDAEQDGSGFHDDGLHDDLRWAGGSAIGTDWMTEHKAVWAGTRALAIRHSPYFQAMANGGAAPFRERIGRREIQRTGYQIGRAHV